MVVYYDEHTEQQRFEYTNEDIQ